MEAAATLSELGYKVLLLEREGRLGGKLAGWHKLFPSLTPAGEVLSDMVERLERSGAEIKTGVEVVRIGDSSVELASGEILGADALVMANGFEIFNARLKEEYGYGIYANVFTSTDIEEMMNRGRVATASGKAPERIALLHCVGSRDEKVGQRHCSKVCCITGVKQAMELKEMFPQSEIYNFYMDIRMFGPGYEEMYRSAQQDYNIHFIRGRISEASETIDKKIQIKTEDTLVGRPMKMTVDMLVLIVGMAPGRSNALFAANPSVRLSQSGFVEPRDLFTGSVLSGGDNIFYAGTVTAPKTLGESITEGNSAALAAARHMGTLL